MLKVDNLASMLLWKTLNVPKFRSKVVRYSSNYSLGSLDVIGVLRVSIHFSFLLLYIYSGY